MASLRSYRLSSQSQYRQISSEGKYIRACALSMRWIESPDGICRFCFIAKKKNGNAVYRNRCRRILRPIFFNACQKFKKPVWAMIFVLDKADEMTSERIHESAEKLIEKLNRKFHVD